MASAWGSSWGSAWGNAWGRLAALVIDTHDGQESKRAAERFRQKKEELRAQLSAAFNKTFGIVEPEIQEIAAKVTVVEQLITKAIDEKTMAEIAEKVTRIVMEIREREEQDDEEAILLLAA